MILTALRAGLRLGELMELRWDDLDLIKGVLRVRRAIWGGVVDTPKGGRTREVPLVMRGVPLKAVQELLGHASIEMTMRYAHLAPDVSRDAVRLLDAPAPAMGRAV